MRTHASLAVLAPLFAVACATAPAPAPAASGSAAVDAAAPLAAICRTEHVDGSSKIYVARDPSGKITRYSVTPSKRMADMGNLIFDAQGNLLGHDTGGEFPWDDKAARAKEDARVAALFGGAVIAKGDKTLSCP